MLRRRTVLAFVTAVPAAAAWARAGARGLVGIAPLAAPPDVGEAEFLDLSRFLTGHDDLDAAVGRVLYRLVAEEPWGSANLAALHARLRVLAAEDAPDRDRALADPDAFDPGLRWFVDHLLVSWYTGVYYHERGHHGLTLTGALMWRALEGWRTPPSTCSGAPGWWAAPPADRGTG